MLEYFTKLRIVIFVLICISLNNNTWAQKTYKKILLVNSYHIGYPWTDSITSGIISVVNKEDNIDLYVEHLDGKRYEDTAYFKGLFKIYQIKYKPGMFDIVILSDNLALNFSLSYGKLLYGDVPVVFCGVGNPENYSLSDIPYYGVLEKGMDEPVLKLISNLMPKLKIVHIISDKTQNGLMDLQRKEKLIHSLPSNISCDFIDDIDIDSLFIKVKTFKETDAILLISLQRDKYGNPLNYFRITNQLCNVSQAPVFCNYFSNIGRGVIGGSFVNPVEQGRLSATIALNILLNSDFVPQKLTIPSIEYRFDYNVLKKFNIQDSSLPKGSIILNKPENLFKKYRNIILTTISIFSFLIIVIILMIENIVRRRKSEKIIKKQYAEIQEQNSIIASSNQNLNDILVELETTNETLNVVNTELIHAKEHAEESDRLKTSFLQNMSHEIRTPMNAIMGFSALLVEQYNNKSKIEQYSGIINRRCNDLLEIINDILDIAKIESGQLSVSIENCNLTELFEELTTFYKEHQKIIAKEHIKFSLKAYCSPSDNVISTDPGKLKQIFINLISNAFKFTDTGIIEGGCKLDANNKLVFYLSDTGVGIEPDKQQMVFERFTQLNPEATRQVSGTGLGLSIVKGLIKLLNGEIFLESQPGAGSTFSFTISYKTVHSKQKENITTHRNNKYHSPNGTILIVEDDFYNAQYLKEVLINSGYEILHCIHGREAVQIALSQKVDLILMDIRLPDIDGYEATRQIKLQKPEIKIIAQTAYASVTEKQNALNAGCNDYISKPAKKESLLAIISTNI
jgi:signal transduction histidine kinase/CheY-like chemotaxis protein